MTKLRVRVRPGARRSGLRGWLATGELKIEVAAPPEHGRANEAVEELLATLLGVARGQVGVTLGHASRRKIVEIEGMTENEVRDRLTRALEAGRSRGE